MRAGTLRLIAVVGVVGSLALAAGTSFPLAPRQDSGFTLLAVIAPLVLLAIALFMPGALRELWRQPDLLVPLGVYLLAIALLGWLGSLHAFAVVLLNLPPIPIAKLALPISIVFLLGLALALVHDTWQTVLIRERVGRGQGDLVSSLRQVRRWFWRVAGLESLCWAALLMIGGALVASVGGSRPGAQPSMVWMFVLVVAFSLVLNLGTGALLLAALDPRLSYWQSVRHGLRRSWQTKSRWALPMIVQMLLLGLLTYTVVSYSESGGPGSSSSQHTSSFNVNGMWVGGYESECRWYLPLTNALKTQPVPLVTASLNLLFGVMAVAMKLTVARGLARGEPAAPPG
jgi:hypothetical protein